MIEWSRLSYSKGMDSAALALAELQRSGVAALPSIEAVVEYWEWFLHEYGEDFFFKIPVIMRQEVFNAFGHLITQLETMGGQRQMIYDGDLAKSKDDREAHAKKIHLENNIKVSQVKFQEILELVRFKHNR